MDADGSNVIQLTHGGYNVEPTWGPGDHELAFSSLLDGGMGLAVIDTDTDTAGSQGPTILLSRLGYNAQPAWSPDGQTITFTSDYRYYDFVYDLYAMNANGSQVRILLEGPFLSDYVRTYFFQSAWSPDGQSIAISVCPDTYEFCSPDNGSAIAVANADGTGLREIAQAGGYQVKPTWSPDGRWIAYGSTLCHDCESSIRYVQVDGDIEGLIVNNGHSPSWRPQASIPIEVGHSGTWFNPAISGQGLFFEFEPESKNVFLGWITYTEDDATNPNEQHWFTAQGQYNDSKAELTLYESLGGRFDHSQAVTTTAVGELTLTFTDCDQGRMTYRLDDRDLAASFPMIRAVPGSVDLCESQTEKQRHPSLSLNLT